MSVNPNVNELAIFYSKYNSREYGTFRDCL